MIEVGIDERGESWFGLAHSRGQLVATAVAGSRQRVLEQLEKCLPRSAQYRIAAESSTFVNEMLTMLAELEQGNEEHKRFTIARELLPDKLAAVLEAAAAIPIGMVSTYGELGRVAGAEARVVGGVMATNPLYPIVPCHRVVGADLSLVGYRGTRNAANLQAKLERLRGEVRGYSTQRKVEVPGVALTVSPVEWVIRKADQERGQPGQQLSLFDEP